MKTFLVRAFVVALALTGAAATAHSKTSSHGVSSLASNGLPPACCMPSQSTCGMD